SFTRSICEPLATLGFEDRQRLLRTVINRVMVEEGHIDIHFAIPVPQPPTKGGPDQGRRVSTDFRLRSSGLDEVRAMRQAIERGGREERLPEEVWPLGAVAIRGQENRAALIPFVDDVV